ncbi:hypothetical protein UFOVP22_45 [uncultured Caudovirales phage]|uniref:Uncharacterized protein n=1 Tax=uncultured Caudovirales phage TaxID=2100421 RepID=A0A6J5T8M7_9CAUD|nr:hypothetical protein UFOVP22_45 [uncultured Caudovirales phage]
MTFTKENLITSKICPCCGGKLKLIKIYGKFNLASNLVLKCKSCNSTF